MTSVFIHNFGCRVNQAEAFDWVDRLNQAGVAVVRDMKRADLVVINACALTASAEADVRQFVRKVRREAPGAKIILTGCLSDKTREEIVKSGAVSLLIPNARKDTLVEELLNLTGAAPASFQKTAFRSRALLKVQDGCDAHCTFCIIPSLRGRSRSRSLEQVVECARAVVERGYREVVLAGIHLCAYGQDFQPPLSLLDLLKALVEIPGLKMIRLSSLDPRLLPQPLLEFIVGEEKICPHFHLSLQHASPAVLRRMGRKSTPEEYLEILNFLRQGRPEASLGADIIVGFPGESDSDFEFLKNFLQHSPLNYFHVFSYSPRAGTPAASWEPVPASVRKKRSAELRRLSREKNLSFRKLFAGKELPGIVIRKKDKTAEILTGNYIKVMVEGREDLRPGEYVRVRIVEVGPVQAKGEVVDG
ncbi:MAG: tRNA (N(6)-L-threonylcarbamoyladenosine(37)-C(2))-methylthiotransferase MtaB [Candidatus Saccharicenans sp.]